MENEKRGTILKVENVAKILGIKKQSVRKNLEIGSLKGEKRNGEWEISTNALEDYQKNRYCRKHRPKDTYTISEVCLFTGKTRDEILALIDQKTLDATQSHSVWFLDKTNLHHFIDQEASIWKDDLKQPIYEEIVCIPILNIYGIAPDVSVEIIKICSRYREHTLSIYRDKTEFKIKNCLSLVALRIPYLARPKFHCIGSKAKDFAQELLVASKNKFYCKY